MAPLSLSLSLTPFAPTNTILPSAVKTLFLKYRTKELEKDHSSLALWQSSVSLRLEHLIPSTVAESHRAGGDICSHEVKGSPSPKSPHPLKPPPSGRLEIYSQPLISLQKFTSCRPFPTSFPWMTSTGHIPRSSLHLTRSSLT